MILPFTQVGGNWYVITNWQPGMKPGKNLELRALSEQESEWLEPCLEDAVMECWARLFRDDEAIRNGAEPPDED